MAEQDLSDHERQLILKFAANPLDFFSGETRGWLEDFIHLSGSTGVGSGGGGGATGSGVNVAGHFAWVAKDLTAEVAEYVFEDASGQYLYCNGVAVSQSTYSDLYAYFGANAYGTDSGGNFFLPDARGRAVFSCGTHASTDLGDNDGITLASRQVAHQHSVSISGSGTTSSDSAGTPAGTVSAHTHSEVGFTSPATIAAVAGGGSDGFGTVTSGSATPTFTGSALSGHSHTVSVTGSGTAGSGMAFDGPAHIYIGSLVVRF